MNNQATAVTLATAPAKNYIECKLVPTDTPITHAKYQVFKGDGQTPLKVVGSMEVQLTLANWKARTTFWVVVECLAEGAILGYNWLEAQGAIIDI